ncbi:MAG: hypothetical protein C0503_08125, partial [Gemmatimonas sp.]|nr:hypothetical protein [Gemmatimonas sp.]
MDKRFFLAILLTGGVVLLTPVLFPRPSVPTPIVADSTTTPAAPATAAAAPAAPAATMAAAPSADASSAPASTATATPPSVPLAPVETLTVSNALTTFAFSSQGAQLLRAELPKFARLGADSGRMTLAHGREALMRYTILAGGDTLALASLNFTATREASASGETLRFAAAVGSGRVEIAYTLAPENYLATVRVSASGLPQPAFLITQLPTGFDSYEADPNEDARHLSYAYKPVISGAERIDFRKPDPGERMLESGPFTWAVAKNKYFLVGVLTPEGQQSAFAELQVTGAVRENKIAKRAQGVVVSPLGDAPLTFELYAGPQEWERLVGMGREFEKTNPYGGWISGVVQPFATIVMRLLLWLKKTTALEYGWILVGFGVAIRLLMWPLNSRMMRTQIEMQRIAPLVQEAQNKHKGDPEKQRLAVMKVYQDHNV